jgi:hypothetical protein
MKVFFQGQCRIAKIRPPHRGIKRIAGHSSFHPTPGRYETLTRDDDERKAQQPRSLQPGANQLTSAFHPTEKKKKI